MKFQFAFLLLAFSSFAAGAAPAPASDPLGRDTPRSTVTAFLEACHEDDYTKAAEYLNLSRISARARAEIGPQRATDLEAVLNSDSHFDVLRLSNDPQGNRGDQTNPNVDTVTTITKNGETYTIDLQRQTPANGPAIWLFSVTTVEELPNLVPVPSTETAIEARLPRFLVTVHFLDTALWKWIALLVIGAVVALVFRLLVRLLKATLVKLEAHYQQPGAWAWLQAVLEPVLVLLAVTVFRILEELINPSALARLYVGRCLLMLVVMSLAWSVINLFDLFLSRLDHILDVRQRMVARSMIYLARRVVHVLVIASAGIIVLDNWDIRMTTIIAGLGVGGIAVALAAQQTIANVFGGVSVISDSPVMIGDFGNFGGVMGTVEEIGMRSARVRTLNRTVVSIPNSSFAGMNLENYAVRDKILFNPTFTIKRSTPKDQIRRLLEQLRDALSRTAKVEAGNAPVRISAFAAASFTIEIFVYVQTSDLEEYYKHQADLFLAINDMVTSSGIELV
ncbi:MAG TPA: mechanosensitive ion channel family protein [Bryobacteraceae bacterium]|jgi:MscS family membrane protein|nr:mechanosensitive ion channel family protein [Bryobacteraceae bacterium]